VAVHDWSIRLPGCWSERIYEGVRRFSVSPRCSKMKYRHLLYACITKFDIMGRSVRSKHVPLHLESCVLDNWPVRRCTWVETDEKRFMICNAGKASPITIFSDDIKVAGQTEGMALTIDRIERTFTLEEAFCECRSAKYSHNVLIWSCLMR